MLLAIQDTEPESELCIPDRDIRDTGESPDQVREVEYLGMTGEKI